MLEARFGADFSQAPLAPRFGPLGAVLILRIAAQGWLRHVPHSISKKEERKWARLELPIPVFIRAREGSGKDSLEFATAINISPGGALVLVRRSLPKSALISLEIPSAPIGPTIGLKTSSPVIQAKAVWVTHLDAYHLLGLKFDHPLSTVGSAVSGRHLRKARSAV